MSHNCENSRLTQDMIPVKHNTHFCICCLKNNCGLVILKNCKHSEFLNKFSIANLNLQDQLICYECHSVLKKIKQFEILVENSFNTLSSGSFNSNINFKPAKLKIEKAVDVSIQDTLTSTETDNGDSNKNKVEAKLKNIQTALDIIESSNSVPFTDLLSAFKNLRYDNILGLPLNKTVVPQSVETSQSIGDSLKNNNSLKDTIRPQKTKHSNPIRKVKITKKQLIHERYTQKTSKDYLKYPYKCKNCIQGFNYKENLEDHTKRKHDAKLGDMCQICAQVHPAGTLDGHIQRHFHRYMCVDCLKMFQIRHDALHHYAKKHVMRYKCEICGHMFENIKEMREHKFKRHRFVCVLCNIVCTTSRRLKWHIMKHKDARKDNSEVTPTLQELHRSMDLLPDNLSNN